MRTLITGATGFLGHHLLPKLAAFCDVTALARKPFQTPAGGCVKVGSLFDEIDERFDVIIHLAALVHHKRDRFEEIYRTNVDGTVSVIRSAAKCGARVIFVSTSGTVGCFRTADEWADEDSPFCEKTVAKWPYYDSKIAAEKIAVNVAKQLGVPLTIVRIPVLLGPEDTIGRSTSYVRKAIEGRFPFYVHGGIAFADVRDVADAIATLARSHQFTRPVLHLPGHDCSLGEFFSQCAQIAGTRPPRAKVPRWLALGLARSLNTVSWVSPKLRFLPDPVVVEMGSHFWAIRSKYAHEIGFRARAREQTLGDTIDWIRSRS